MVTSVGQIGLGLMGHAIAARLVSHGLAVFGCDISPHAMQRFNSLGERTHASTPQQILESQECVVFSLPSHRDVSGVLHQHAGALRSGLTVFDTTTGDPESAVQMSEFVAQHGAVYLEAPISGSSAQLAQGQAVVLIGGDRAAYERVFALAEKLGRTVYYTGPPGSGAQMKLVTNLVLGLNRAALAEGLVYAESLGLDLKNTLEVLQGSAAASRIMDRKGQKMIDREFSPQARLSQHLRDVRLILKSASSEPLSFPLSKAHQAILEAAETLHLGDLDNSALIEVLRQHRKTE